jgi:hypothetical protein
MQRAGFPCLPCSGLAASSRLVAKTAAMLTIAGLMIFGKFSLRIWSNYLLCKIRKISCRHRFQAAIIC